MLSAPVLRGGSPTPDPGDASVTGLVSPDNALRPGIIQEIGNMSSLATMDTMESRPADIIRDDLINDLLASPSSHNVGEKNEEMYLL